MLLTHQAADQALDHYNDRQKLVTATSQVVGDIWTSGVDPRKIVDSWANQLPEVTAIVSGAQLAAARPAARYVDDMLDEEGVDPAPAAEVVPSAFSGQASDARGLLGLLTNPVFVVLSSIQDGLDVAHALFRGKQNLEMIASTQVADAGRLADQVGITSRLGAQGYIRMAVGNSCARCLILSGRFYQFNAGFARHPRCDCIHVVASSPNVRFARSPEATYARMTAAERTRAGFTAADQRAIAEGADLGQVVNAKRGMYTAGGRKLTTEGTTRRGLHGGYKIDPKTGKRIRRPKGEPVPPRLSVDEIFKISGDNRDEALALLADNGYVVELPKRVSRAEREEIFRRANAFVDGEIGLADLSPWLSAPNMPSGVPATGAASIAAVRPVLARAKSMKGLEFEFGAEYFAITGKRLKAFELQGSLDTAKEHCEGLLRGLERFPDANLRAVYTIGPTDSRYAEAAGNYVGFNETWTGNRKRYLASLQADEASGFHPRNTGNPVGTAVHEFGHTVDLGTLGHAIKADVDAVLARAAAETGLQADRVVELSISKYAARDSHELVAEAFADVLINGPAASRLSREIMDLLKAEYRKGGRRIGSKIVAASEPAVDLSKLTVPKLRALAKERGVTIPPGSKKPDILRLLDEGPTKTTAPAAVVDRYPLTSGLRGPLAAKRQRERDEIMSVIRDSGPKGRGLQGDALESAQALAGNDFLRYENGRFTLTDKGREYIAVRDGVTLAPSRISLGELSVEKAQNIVDDLEAMVGRQVEVGASAKATTAKVRAQLRAINLQPIDAAGKDLVGTSAARAVRYEWRQPGRTIRLDQPPPKDLTPIQLQEFDEAARLSRMALAVEDAQAAGADVLAAVRAARTATADDAARKALRAEARARQAEIDAAATRADALAELDELVVKNASMDVLTRNLDIFATTKALAPADITALRRVLTTRDRAKIAATVDRISKKYKLTGVHSAGDVTKMREGFQTVGGPIPVGADVQVIRRGTEIVRNGEVITVSQPVVRIVDLAEKNQAALDTIRGAADALSEARELVANEASARALAHRARARRELAGIPDTAMENVFKAMESGDSAKILKAIAAAEKKLQLTPIGVQGDLARFDRRQFRPIGKSIDDGALVMVTRVGYTGTLGIRSDLLLYKAVVQEVDAAFLAQLRRAAVDEAKALLDNATRPLTAAQLKKAGIAKVGTPSKTKTVAFDPKTMDVKGVAPAAGAKVRVVEPGYSLTYRGETVLLRKPVVEVVEVKAAPVASMFDGMAPADLRRLASKLDIDIAGTGKAAWKTTAQLKRELDELAAGVFDVPTTGARLGIRGEFVVRNADGTLNVVRQPIRWRDGVPPPGWDAARMERASEALFSYGQHSFEVNMWARGLLPESELRSFTAREITDNIAALDDIIAAAPLSEDLTVWRGIHGAGGMFGDRLSGNLTGLDWVEDGFMSTSVRREVSERFALRTGAITGGSFASGGGSLLMRITLPAGTPAAQVKILLSEAEVLTRRGLRLRVVADHGMHGGIRLIDVEVVPA